MVHLYPIDVGGNHATAIEVALPKTTLVTVVTPIGYIMCGALDVGLLNEKLADRGIIAARAVGVRTVEQLLEAPIESATIAAQRIGIVPGITGQRAVELMINHNSEH